MNVKNKLIYYRDASWERDPDAFQELYEQYEHCDSDKCECPKGRDYGANKGYVFHCIETKYILLDGYTFTTVLSMSFFCL